MSAVWRFLRSIFEALMPRSGRFSLSVRRVVPGSPATPSAIVPISALTIVAPAHVVIGRTTTFAAVDQLGRAVTGVTWGSSVTSKATIDASGNALGVASGATNITASVVVAGATITATPYALTVEAQVLTSILLGGGTGAVVATHAGAAFTASGKDQLGIAMTVQPTFTFASSAPSVATIGASSGVPTGVAAGSTNITASSGAVTSNVVALSVVAQIATDLIPSPSSLSVAIGANSAAIGAAVLDQLGSPISGASLSFASSDASLATVGSSSGIVHGVAAGSPVITISSTVGGGTATGTVGVTVSAAVVAPTFTSITPNTIAQNTSGTYSIVGDNLNASQFLAGLPSRVTASALTITDAQHATVTLSATATATLGAASIKITDPVSGDSGAVALSVTAGTPSGAARTSLIFNKTTATVHPAATLSTTLPLPHANGSPSWRSLLYGGSGSGGTSLGRTTSLGTPQSAYLSGFVSDPLSEQFIPAGTYEFDYGLYADGGALYKLAPVITVWRPSTGAVVGVIRDSATGIGSDTMASNLTYGKVASISLATGFAIQDGDRLVVELYAVGGANDSVSLVYDGNGTPTEGGTGFAARLVFPGAIYTAPSPLGIVRVGPSGLSNTNSASVPIPGAIVVTDDAGFRGCMQTGMSLWDSAATAKQGTATHQIFPTNSGRYADLVSYDTTMTYTDRDGTVHNMLKIEIKPNGGAPLDPSKDAIVGESNTPELTYSLPAGRTFTSYYARRVVSFGTGFRMDCPNNAASNASGYNFTQSGAYKWGPHLLSNSTRCDFEITGGQNPGSEYATGTMGTGALPTSSDPVRVTRQSDGHRDPNYILSGMSAIMPGWNTDPSVRWEIVRCAKVVGQTLREKVWIGKLTDATLTLVKNESWVLDAGYQFNKLNGVSVLGLNFNRQLASTDATPTCWVGDTDFGDPTESVFAWPAQIPVGDQF